MIRYATIDDLDFMMDLCREFYTETNSDRYFGFDDKSVEITLKNAIAYDFIITDGENGILVFHIYPTFYNFKELILGELFFYVRKDISPMLRGIIACQLLERIDEEAEKHSVRHVKINNMIRYRHDNVSKLYERFGFELRENEFMKDYEV